jgi:ubiquinone/menaquinone biosynthesis C-methylase UbiE
MAISFDRIAKDYDKTRELPKKKMDEIVSALIKEFSDCSTILDVGVGTGRFALPLQEGGVRVIGIDIGERMLEKAKEKRVNNLIRADALKMPFRNKTIDACLSVHFLHLVSGWRGILGEIERVSKKKYVSLCYRYHSRHSDPIRQEYYRLLGEMGHQKCRPGVGETELISLMKPDRVEWICTTRETRIVKKALNLLEKKTFSSQWDIPDDIHRKAMTDLRSMFAQKKTVSHTYTMGLVIWNILTIREFLSHT